MKTLLASTFLLCILVLLPGISASQTIAIGAIPGSHFCVGDPISVPFTVTGFWNHRNAFTLQLSDYSGSFANFQILGSLVDTLPGTFAINSVIPVNLFPYGGYRFRIVAALPYTVSADNGSDITIGRAPYANIVNSLRGGSTGTPITFTDNDNALYDTAYWDFGSGAKPATAAITGTYTIWHHVEMCGKPYLDTSVVYAQNVTYSTTGDKTVTLRVVSPGGCSTATSTHSFHIFDCSNPSIPHDAIVINADTTVEQTGQSRTYWVNPGFKFTAHGLDTITIFAESGSIVSGGYLCYMKPGSMSGSRAGFVIYGDGTNIHDGDLHCPGMTFDYSTAPPNRAFPSAVKSDLNTPTISLSPNPTHGMLRIAGLPSVGSTVAVYDVLGNMEVLQSSRASEISLDLSKLLPGTYFVRLSSANSVVTKKVVKQ